MKKKLALLIGTTMVMMGVLAACGKKDDNTIIVGTEAGFAPYEYMVGNDVVGVDMDIAKAIAEHMGKELVIKNMEFDAALVAVEKGTVDFVAAGVSIKPERLEKMDFSDHYVDSTDVIIVNKATPAIATADADGLKDKIVAVQQGNIADFWVEENTEPKEIKRYTKFAQAAEDLKNNKVDAIVMDYYPALELVAENSELAVLDGTLFEDNYAIAVQKGNQELLDEINAVIGKLIEDGKIEEFYEAHTSK